MREIKFRAWDGKKWWIVTSVSFIEYDPDLVAAYGHGGGYYLIEGIDKDGNRFKGTSIDTKLVAYTGLKDKNGKEIYEGDIVKGGWHKTAAIYEVRWYRGGFMLHENGHFGFSDMESHDGDSKYLEVIGNIYENSELIKSEG